MVSEQNLIIKLGIDSSETNAEMTDLEQRGDAVVREWAQKRRQMERELQQTVSTINSVISLFRNAARMFGVVLDPVQEAMLMTIQAGLDTALAVAAMMSSTGVGTAAGAIVASIAFSMSIVATAQAAAGIDDAQRQFAAVDATLASLERSIYSFSRWF